MMELPIIPEQLMARAQAGDQSAYRLVLQHCAVLLRPVLARTLSHTADRDDVLQEILISVHKARHTYDAERPFKPWLLAIARFRLKDHWRKLYGDELRHSLDLADFENNFAAPVTNSGDAYEYLQDSIKLLPQKQAAILRLMHEEGYTAREAAERLGMKESAVKVAAHRAYKWLRGQLEAR